MKIAQEDHHKVLNRGWIDVYQAKTMKKNVSTFRKFCLLMWKNWLLQRRRKKQTLIEIVFSVVFCILLVIIRDLAPSNVNEHPTTFQPFDVSSLPESLKPSNTDLFSAMVNYVMSSDNEARRRRREIQLPYFTTIDNASNFQSENTHFNIEKAKKMPKIQSFLKENPDKEKLINHLLHQTEMWVYRRKNLYERWKHETKRNKRYINLADLFFTEPAWPIAYAPNNSVVEEIMHYVGKYLYLDTEGYGFATESDMVKHITSFYLDPDKEDSNFFGLEDVLGGIIFTNDFLNDSFPQDIKYKIRLKGSPRSGKKKLSLGHPPRWNTELTYPLFQIPGPRERHKDEGGDPGYFEEGFLAIQFAIDKGIADYMNGKEIDSWASLKMQRMPYPPYYDDTYLVVLQAWLPLVLLLSYLYPAVNIAKNVIYEKENKLKESMKMMGLDNWLHWTAWCVKSLMFLLVTTALVTLLLCTRWNGKESLAVLDNSDPSLVFLFLFIYSCCAISFCFFLSTIFSKANNGATALGIVWLFSYLPNMYLRPRFHSLSTNLKIGICVYFNIAMSLGCFLAAMFEGTGSGLQWNLLSSGVSPDSPFCMADVLCMMIFDIFLYAVLTWYIEGVFPGEFGVPLPWNFPFKKEYWCGYSSVLLKEEADPPVTDPTYFETSPVGLNPGIKIKGLTKVFGKKIAVNNMHLDMYANQITVLLGHNGAGKTTTMSMLTGLFPPTRGTAKVNGFDIVTSMKEVRDSIGICPQHDVLFDDLTVTEHIKFFSELKGLEKKKVSEEVAHILNGIRLLDKAGAQARTLSGGMKRKLSVGIALCGNSRVVILDEPTSGMDPGARRVIWDLLQKERNGRTILLTTHFMEEADLLGDRIAIMADGVVQCCGSSMFLKKTYGAGYHLVIVKERDCDVNEITDVITSHVPDAEIELNVAAELTYILPNENVANFENLFEEIEARREELKISSYGASQTTMEEVFLRVGENANPEVKMFFQKDIPSRKEFSEIPKQQQQQQQQEQKKNQEEQSRLLYFELDNEDISRKATQPKRSEFFLQFFRRFFFFLPVVKKSLLNNVLPESKPRRESLKRNTGAKLLLQQSRAMIVKKVLYTVRNLPITIVQLLIPVMFLIMAMVILRNIPGINDSPPPLVFSPKVYDGTETTVQNLLNSSLSQEFLKFYADQFEHKNTFNLIPPQTDVSSFLLEKASEDLPSFNLHWIMALKLHEDTDDNRKLGILSLFNNQPYHVPPMTLNLVDQALLRMSVNMPELTITTINHPLPRTNTEKLTQESRQNIGFNIGFSLAFGMSFLSASLVLFVIKERTSNCKHLQFVSGVNFVVFWLATALWDFFCLMITCLLILLSLYFYQEEGLSEGPQLFRIFIVLLLYSWSILPFMYIASFFFSIPSTGFTRMSMIHIFTGMATLITVMILRIPDLELMDVADILDWCFLVFPPYALASAIGDLYANIRYTKICSMGVIRLLCSLGTFENPCCFTTDSCGSYGCVSWTSEMFRWERLGVGRMLAFMAIEGVVFYIVIAMIEMNWHRSLKYAFNNLYQKLICKMTIADIENGAAEEENEDVRTERQRIQNTNLEELFKTDKLVLRDLCKIYKEGVFAVNKLNLGVPLGECFGLLGINGAGKTTTFKMLTGQLPVSSGDAYVNGYSVKSNIKKVQQEVGYCPQFDAVLDQMTGRETLRMFARLRGVPESRIDENIKTIADQLLVTTHLDKQVGKYSGGNKRKISTGIALIGDPPLVLLDEPTSGMDPVARRHLWDALNSVRDTGRCIILTSHSMEECEALCTRIAIMTNGTFQCLGSPQQLKNKFSEGYSIVLRISLSDTEEIEDENVCEMPHEMNRAHQFILSTFKESFLREMQRGRLEYFIPVEAASWAKVFGILERNKEELQIEDYAVTQTTLERVFLNFTRTQRPEKTD